MTHQPTVTASFATLPRGFANVTREEFFRILKADARDIMPDHSEPDVTTWRVVSTRQAWGLSAPGWRNPSAHAPCYAINFADLPLSHAVTAALHAGPTPSLCPRCGIRPVQQNGQGSCDTCAQS